MLSGNASSKLSTRIMIRIRPPTTRLDRTQGDLNHLTHLTRLSTSALPFASPPFPLRSPSSPVLLVSSVSIESLPKRLDRTQGGLNQLPHQTRLSPLISPPFSPSQKSYFFGGTLLGKSGPFSYFRIRWLLHWLGHFTFLNVCVFLSGGLYVCFLERGETLVPLVFTLYYSFLFL